MAAAHRSSTERLVIEDEFGPLLEEQKRDPAFRTAYEDATDLHRILDCLVSLRRAKHLSQTDVAERMGVRQPTVSGFETEGSDPRLSTLQRYARAVSGRLRLRVDIPSSCDWIATSRREGFGTVGSAKLADRTAIERPKTVELTTLPRDWVRRTEWRPVA